MTRTRRAAESLCWLLLMLAVAVVIIAVASVLRPAHAHLHDRPDLNPWIMGLHNGNGASCCDGTDALRLDDPQWDNENGHYRVFLKNVDGIGEWVVVPDAAVISEPNKYGPALVWPYYSNGHPVVRCFLPGAGS